jgi:membrane-bound lytic murein transglycosylase B
LRIDVNRQSGPVFGLCCIFLVILSLATPGLTAWSFDNEACFATLRQRLIKDAGAGFDSDLIADIYKSPSLNFDFDGISRYFLHRESSLNYDQFLSSESIGMARAYSFNHHADLLKAEIDYGVDRTVIAAIMLVETRFGSYLGKSAVVNTLSTMAALDDPNVRKMFWENLQKNKRVSHDKFEKKAAQKSKWAYAELKAFIQYVHQEGFDPFSINGSYAGAMGIAQFMPSNVITLATDGNQDGRVNLFQDADAIYSIANYLKHHGWKPGISEETARKVIARYNHSSYYVDTVLKVSAQLKLKG